MQWPGTIQQTHALAASLAKWSAVDHAIGTQRLHCSVSLLLVLLLVPTCASIGPACHQYSGLCNIHCQSDLLVCIRHAHPRHPGSTHEVTPATISSDLHCTSQPGTQGARGMAAQPRQPTQHMSHIASTSTGRSSADSLLPSRCPKSFIVPDLLQQRSDLSSSAELAVYHQARYPILSLTYTVTILHCYIVNPRG